MYSHRNIRAEFKDLIVNQETSHLNRFQFQFQISLYFRYSPVAVRFLPNREYRNPRSKPHYLARAGSITFLTVVPDLEK